MKCKVCKDKFKQKYFLQNTCLKPKCVLSYSEIVKQKAWNKKKKVIKESLKTKSNYANETQIAFNKFIRLRDKGNNCISCDKPCKKENAGHYKSVGSTPELRYEELNVHLQCEYCNTYLHGNIVEYRINLIKKIGIEKVEWLEKQHPIKNYSIQDLKDLKSYYKKIIPK